MLSNALTNNLKAPPEAWPSILADNNTSMVKSKTFSHGSTTISIEGWHNFHLEVVTAYLGRLFFLRELICLSFINDPQRMRVSAKSLIEEAKNQTGFSRKQGSQ